MIINAYIVYAPQTLLCLRLAQVSSEWSAVFVDGCEYFISFVSSFFSHFTEIQGHPSTHASPLSQAIQTSVTILNISDAENLLMFAAYVECIM